jgi:uncharacterized protein YndB with AHSA1/START domain
MKAGDRIEKHVKLRAPVSRVWRAIADAQEFGRWFGFTLEGPFEPGRTMKGTFDLKLDEAGLMEMQKKGGVTPSRVKVPQGSVTLFTVERVDPQRYFSFRWIPYSIDAEADLEHEHTTLVEFTLEPSAEGTSLTIVESGFERVPERRRARAFLMNDGGWASQAESLGKYVDRA